VFALIGISGILTQGLLIGPLTRKFGTRRLIPMAIVITGIGLVLIPYSQYESRWLHVLIVGVLVSVGNGLFTPSSSSFLTRIAKSEGYELGVVMGAQESVSAFSRIIGPLTGGFVWVLTYSRDWPFDYHTAFHICGILMAFAAVLSLKLPPLPEEEHDSQSAVESE
jgi:MFS family permease